MYYAWYLKISPFSKTNVKNHPLNLSKYDRSRLKFERGALWKWGFETSCQGLLHPEVSAVKRELCLRAARTRALQPRDSFHIPRPAQTDWPQHLPSSPPTLLWCRCKEENRQKRSWRKRRTRTDRRRAARLCLSHKLRWRSTRQPFTGNTRSSLFCLCLLLTFSFTARRWIFLKASVFKIAAVCLLTADTRCSLCWRCCSKNASSPLRAQTAWPRPVSTWISRTSYGTRRKKARLSSARTPIWTIW